MSDTHDNTPVAVTQEEPLPNPGLPAHTWRPTDIDEKAEKRAERQVAAFFVASMLFAVLFVVGYFGLDTGDNWHTIGPYGASTMVLGLCLGLSLLCIGIGIIHWARKLMADHELVEERHRVSSPPEDREATLEALNTGIEETGIARRPLIRNTLIASLGMLGIPAIVALRDLGPLPGDKLYHTLWGAVDGKDDLPKIRISRDGIGTPILASDLEIGDLVNCLPHALYDPDRYGIAAEEVEGVNFQVHKSKTALILLRMDPGDIKPGKDKDGNSRENWSVDGIVAYSKICTHVGCPISLNERTTHHLLCPCHQSTFDMADSGKVVFGPAGRPLPQLPLDVDEEGYLVAASDFDEPIGASFWERDYYER